MVSHLAQICQDGGLTALTMTAIREVRLSDHRRARTGGRVRKSFDGPLEGSSNSELKPAPDFLIISEIAVDREARRFSTSKLDGRLCIHASGASVVQGELSQRD